MTVAVVEAGGGQLAVVVGRRRAIFSNSLSLGSLLGRPGREEGCG